MSAVHIARGVLSEHLELASTLLDVEVEDNGEVGSMQIGWNNVVARKGTPYLPLADGYRVASNRYVITRATVQLPRFTETDRKWGQKYR